MTLYVVIRTRSLTDEEFFAKKAFCNLEDAVKARDAFIEETIKVHEIKHLLGKEIPTHDDAAREFIVYEDFGDKRNLYHETFDIISVPFDGRIEIPLHDKEKLVAEVNCDSGYKEICVGIEDNGTWWQDLAIVGESYYFDNNLNMIPNHGEYNVKVYGHSWDEDFTDEYDIPKYKEEE